jgi:hypothetical protein
MNGKVIYDFLLSRQLYPVYRGGEKDIEKKTGL